MVRILTKPFIVVIVLILPGGCGGGGGSGDPEPVTEKTFSLQLNSADIRLSGSGEPLQVDTEEIKREQLSVR